MGYGPSNLGIAMADFRRSVLVMEYDFHPAHGQPTEKLSAHGVKYGACVLMAELFHEGGYHGKLDGIALRASVPCGPLDKSLLLPIEISLLTDAHDAA